MQESREEGFYWLTSHSGDTIGLWEESLWEMLGISRAWSESDVLSMYMIGDKIER